MFETLVIDFAVFVIGACVGSFLNVCIVRLPHELSVVTPGSHCVSCKKPVAWFDNIPLVSYWVLGGKCRYCKAGFSPRYWFVELITALVFWGLFKWYGLTAVTAAYWVLFSGFIVATFVDFEHRIIPDEVSVGGMFAGIALSAMIPSLHSRDFALAGLGGFGAGLVVVLCVVLTLALEWRHRQSKDIAESADDRMIKIFVMMSLLVIFAVNLWGQRLPAGLLSYALSLSSALSGYIIGGGTIYLMGLVGDMIFKKESMGGGDVKLMAMIGAFLGWKLALLTFFVAPFFGAVYGIVEKIRTKDSAIAYGPFLVLGAVISLFWGDQIIAWIMSGYGLR